MDITLFKSNLTNIIARGRNGIRTVDVAVLKTSLAVVEENERLTRKLAAIEAISSGIETRAA